MGHKKGYWNGMADSFAYAVCAVFTGLFVAAAVMFMLLSAKADDPFDILLVWASKIVAMFAAMFCLPVALKIIASRLDARRLARDQRKQDGGQPTGARPDKDP